ncbi:MAG: prolyl-tRNA synthetase associated domain-containing protein, partial [Gammaproteobacteria bacterium]
MDNEARLYAELEARGIAYEVVEHHAVFTVDESRELNASLPGAHSKNLFLRDVDGRFWLVTVPGDIRVDLKALPATIGSKRLSFGKADDLLRLLGLTPGSVTPLGAIND